MTTTTARGGAGNTPAAQGRGTSTAQVWGVTIWDGQAKSGSILRKLASELASDHPAVLRTAYGVECGEYFVELVLAFNGYKGREDAAWWTDRLIRACPISASRRPKWFDRFAFECLSDPLGWDGFTKPTEEALLAALYDIGECQCQSTCFCPTPEVPFESLENARRPMNVHDGTRLRAVMANAPAWAL